ncbi:hypothetical protein ADS73_00830 [Lactiplantibacillus plantarum]|nr:hypothetical protein ADS73_00830 [Lactiplantibacillus plantarum]
MRKLYLGNGDKQFKFADTTTEINLSAFDDDSAATLTTDAKVRIKNDSGYLLGLSASITDNHATITSGQLNQLPVGNYLLELWDTVNGGTAIYPSDGFLALQINENVTGISGGIVSSITVDDFIQHFSDLSQQLKKEVSDAVSNGLKGNKGDPGKGFRIVKTFPSIAQMNGDGFSDGDFTMIASDVNDPDNGKLYVWNGTSFAYIADLSGSQGIKGDTGTVDNDGLINAPAFQSLQTQADNSAVGTNLLTGTSNVLTTIPNATGWAVESSGHSTVGTLKANKTYTISCYLEPSEHDVAICTNTATGNIFGTTIAAGSKGISTLTITLTPEDVNKSGNVWVAFTSQQTGNSAVSYKGFKLEKGSKATDWCPNPSEILTQSDYAKIKAAIVALGGALS